MLLERTDTTRILKDLSDASASCSPQDYLAKARATLQALLATPDLLSTTEIDRLAGQYTRNLFYADRRISVWAIVWSAGSRSPIHDHHCSCCFGILSGSVGETRFRQVGHRTVEKTGEIIRQAGDIACMIPSGPNIHQMRNDGDADAISIHIYGFDHLLHTSSIDREYSAING